MGGNLFEWCRSTVWRNSRTSSEKVDLTIVAEVLANKYGVNPGRAEKLKQAGYDAYSVQKKINKLNTLVVKIKPIVSTNQDYMDSIVKLIQQ